MGKEDWKSESVRDVVSLGSIPFFFLVLVRLWLLDNPAFLAQFVLSGVLFGLFAYFFGGEIKAGLAFIASLFTAMYYADLRYSVFIAIVYIFILYGLFYLGREKKAIFFGFVFALISSYVGNILSGFFS